MKNNKTAKKAFKYWLFGGTFGLHKMYLNKFKNSDYIYSFTSLSLTLGGIIQLLSKMNLTVTVNEYSSTTSLFSFFNPINILITVLTFIAIIKWIIDGINLRKLVEEANIENKEYIINRKEYLIMSWCSLAYKKDIEKIENEKRFVKEFWYCILLSIINVVYLLIIPLILIATLSKSIGGLAAIIGLVALLIFINGFAGIISAIRGVIALKDFLCINDYDDNDDYHNEYHDYDNDTEYNYYDNNKNYQDNDYNNGYNYRNSYRFNDKDNF